MFRSSLSTRKSFKIMTRISTYFSTISSHDRIIMGGFYHTEGFLFGTVHILRQNQLARGLNQGVLLRVASKLAIFVITPDESFSLTFKRDAVTVTACNIDKKIRLTINLGFTRLTAE